MSMRSYFYTGYGFSVAKVKDLTILKALLNHKETLHKLTNFPIDCLHTMYEKNKNNDCFHFEDMDNEDFDKIEGTFSNISNNDYEIEDPSFYFELFACIMEKETGIGFYYYEGQDDTGSEPTIMLTQKMPWFFSEKERNLTKEECTNILFKYAEELGLTKDYIGEEEVEYFG